MKYKFEGKTVSPPRAEKPIFWNPGHSGSSSSSHVPRLGRALLAWGWPNERHIRPSTPGQPLISRPNCGMHRLSLWTSLLSPNNIGYMSTGAHAPSTYLDKSRWNVLTLPLGYYFQSGNASRFRCFRVKAQHRPNISPLSIQSIYRKKDNYELHSTVIDSTSSYLRFIPLTYPLFC